MREYNIFDKELLVLLMEFQRETSPIRLSIGYTSTDGMVRQGVVIHVAPPLVVSMLIDKGYMCDLQADGMHVYKM